MDENERRSRIVHVAIRLAQGRGFDSVGLREVAEEAGVALGSLYKSFRSKEEIISAAVEHQVYVLRRRFERRPARGDTALSRIDNLFRRLTRALCKRPALARAVLAALTAPESGIAGPVYAQEEEVGRIIVAALRGVTPRDVEAGSVTESERTVSFVLRQVWFAGLVGWSANLYSQPEVVRQVTTTARLLLSGLEAEGRVLAFEGGPGAEEPIGPVQALE